MSLLNIDPNILLYCICKHLEPKDILNLSQTCKTFLEMFPLNTRLRHVITILKDVAYTVKTFPIAYTNEYDKDDIFNEINIYGF